MSSHPKVILRKKATLSRLTKPVGTKPTGERSGTRSAPTVRASTKRQVIAANPQPPKSFGTDFRVEREYFVTAAKGMEPLLVEELQELGIRQVTEHPGGVQFLGRLEDAYRACLWSRIGVRVLMPLYEFDALTPEKLYGGMKSIRWSDHLLPDRTLAVDFVSHHSEIQHTHFGAQKAKDAIVDQLRSIHGERPSVELVLPDVRVNVYLKNNRARVSLDLSGESLHVRGYRSDGAQAPLKENLAAALLRWSGWNRQVKEDRENARLVDPMCGSGTVLIEAAEIWMGRAPGLRRQKFGFTRWLGHDAEAWERLRQEAKAAGKTTESLKEARRGVRRFWGFDIHDDSVRAAQANLQAAGLMELVQIEKKDFRRVTRWEGVPQGFLMVNPPYGERLGSIDELKPLYGELGDWFKKQWIGWKATLITGNKELSKEIGLRASHKTQLFNGPIECRVLQYELYSGTKNESKKENALEG